MSFIVPTICLPCTDNDQKISSYNVSQCLGQLGQEYVSCVNQCLSQDSSDTFCPGNCYTSYAMNAGLPCLASDNQTCLENNKCGENAAVTIQNAYLSGNPSPAIFQQALSTFTACSNNCFLSDTTLPPTANLLPASQDSTNFYKTGTIILIVLIILVFFINHLLVRR